MRGSALAQCMHLQRRLRMTKLAFILSLTLGASVLVAACGGSSINEGADPAGGAGGGGAGKTNGGAGATDPGSCTQHSDCKSLGDCQTLGELEASCRSGSDDFVRYASRCGGTYVEQTDGVTASSWVFDASGKQIGAFYEDEGTCSEWGSTCGPTGPGTSLCFNACIPHDTCAEWGANFGCPATLDDVARYCGGETEIERQPSGCGGTIVDASNFVQHVIWTFDADGKLVAVRSVGDVRDCDYWGTECDKTPTGESELLCARGGEGGMGGQGNAGAGLGGEGGGGAGGAAGAGPPAGAAGYY
jgi:hypothetical protein